MLIRWEGNCPCVKSPTLNSTVQKHEYTIHIISSSPFIHYLHRTLSSLVSWIPSWISFTLHILQSYEQTSAIVFAQVANVGTWVFSQSEII